VNLVIKDSPSHRKNEEEKKLFQKLINTTAIAMVSNFKKDFGFQRDRTFIFTERIAQNLDSRTLSIFL